MREFEEVMTTIALSAMAAIVLLALVRGWWVRRTWTERGWVSRAPPIARVLRIAGAVGLVLLGWGLLNFLHVLNRGSSFLPDPYKWVLSFLVLAWLAAEAVLMLRPRLPLRWPAIARSVAGNLAIWGGAILLAVAFHQATDFPPEAHDVALAVPFDGEWVATGAGPSARTNHHHRIASQRHAVDIAKACADGRLFTGEGVDHDESCTFGALVRAPAEGTVVRVVDGLEDGNSRRQLPGNHVVVAIGEDRFVALAHLQRGSLLVARGDVVRAGQPIARAGNSGNSDFPHLHVHVQDGPDYDLATSRSIPFVFRDAETQRYGWWRRSGTVRLLGNDRIRSRNE